MFRTKLFHQNSYLSSVASGMIVMKSYPSKTQNIQSPIALALTREEGYTRRCFNPELFYPRSRRLSWLWKKRNDALLAAALSFSFSRLLWLAVVCVVWLRVTMGGDLPPLIPFSEPQSLTTSPCIHRTLPRSPA